MSTSADIAAQRRRETIDEAVQRTGPEKSARIDLGVAILHALALPGVCYTQDEIAAFAGCAPGNIYLIEQRALKKLRNRLRFMKDPILREACDHLFTK